MIIAVVAAKTLSGLSAIVRSLYANVSASRPALVDGVELRLDSIASPDWKKSGFIDALACRLSEIKCPVILTVRPVSQGGYYTGSETQRLALLHQLAALNPSFMDIESSVSPAFIAAIKLQYPSVSIIRSYHNFTGTPDTLEPIFAALEHPLVDHYKIVTYARKVVDNLCLLQFLKNQKNTAKLTVHGMGPLGLVSRLIGAVMGNNFQYVRPADSEGLEGIHCPSVSEWLETYRANDVNSSTGIFALLGNPVEASRGHVFHNQTFAQKKINALYLKIPVREEELAAFFKGIKGLPFRGFSVTRPLKEKVMPYLFRADATSRAIGASNTLMVKEGKLWGTNTDGMGAVEAIKTKQVIKGTRLLLIGGGGSAKAIAHSVQLERPLSFFIVNRTLPKAVLLAKKVGGVACDDKNLSSAVEAARFSHFDSIINTVPHDEKSERWVFEVIQPYITKGTVFMSIDYGCESQWLEAHVKAAGGVIVEGYAMFVAQALGQQRCWFGEALV